jgi:hypothetical protein
MTTSNLLLNKQSPQHAICALGEDEAGGKIVTIDFRADLRGSAVALTLRLLRAKQNL